MAGYNKVIALGTLVSDPDVIPYGTEGKELVKIKLACERKYQKQTGEWVSSIDQVPLTFFGKLAQRVAASGRAGMLVMVEGHLTSRERDRRDGGTFVDLDLMGETFTPVGASASRKQQADSTVPYSDIPF